jgi:Flp pilus assembly protein TadD
MNAQRFLATAVAVLALAGACSEKPQPPPQAPAKDQFALLLEAVQKNPKDTDSWMHIADLYERAQNWTAEVDALQKVLALEPGRSFAHVKLGNTYNRLGHYQDAVAAFREAETSRPRDPVLYNNLAFAYGRLGRTAEQVAALRTAVALRPRYSTARVNLGTALLKQGDRKGAEEQLAALVEYDGPAAAALRQELTGGARP